MVMMAASLVMVVVAMPAAATFSIVVVLAPATLSIVVVMVMVLMVAIVMVGSVPLVDAAFEGGAFRAGDFSIFHFVQGFLYADPARDVQSHAQVDNVLPGMGTDISRDDSSQTMVQESCEAMLGKLFRIAIDDFDGPILGVHHQMGGGMAEASCDFGIQGTAAGSDEVLHGSFLISKAQWRQGMLRTAEGSIVGSWRS